MATVDPITSKEAADRGRSSLDVERVRTDFPALDLEVHRHPLVYLDNAATTQKPVSVLEAEDKWYRESCANVHRGVHFLSQKATDAYEEARAKVGSFIRAEHADEIIFVRGTTDAINLVASTFGRQRVGAGDEILISEMEHHSNIVPWQLLCEEKGATLKVAPIDDSGDILMDRFEDLLSERTRLVAVGYISNALGTINPLAQIIELAHGKGVPVLVDGAQAMPHKPVDVRSLECDFFAFSGHKMFGPTGIGGLFGRRDLLREMPPYQGGGEMIRSVSFEGSQYAEPPARVEGQAKEKASVLSFVVEGVHAHDIGTILDREGVAIRAGHHCAQPVMKRYGVAATARASFALYNTCQEAERLAAAIARVREVFG